MSALLPAGFEGLDPFVEFWAVSGSAERDRRRGESTADQRLSFFQAAKGLVGDALALLDARGLGNFDEREDRLMNLMLSFAHVTMAVEMLKDAEPRHARFREVMRITKSPADV